MPRLQCDDGSGAVFGAAAAADAFIIFNKGVQAFVYPDGLHRADLLAGAAGYAFFLFDYRMSFWQNEPLPCYSQKAPGHRTNSFNHCFLILYYAILCRNLQGCPGCIFCQCFSFFRQI